MFCLNRVKTSVTTRADKDDGYVRGVRLGNNRDDARGNRRRTLSLKRDRKQRHKAELTKLERQAENISDTIGGLERAKTAGANLFAYIFGIASTLILGGGMSLVMLIESVPAIACGVILGIIGVALCCINYPIYKKIVQKKTKQVLPVIDDNEEKLANLLEKGNDLLRAEVI